MELEEQGRLEQHVQVRIAVDCIHLAVIHKLNPRHAHAELNGFDNRLNRTLNGLESTDGRRHRFWLRVKPQRDFGDHAQRPLRANEEPR